jgi:hypothetical protein
MRDCCRLRCYAPQTNATQHKKPPNLSYRNAVRHFPEVTLCACLSKRNTAVWSGIAVLAQIRVSSQAFGSRYGNSRGELKRSTFVRWCYHRATGTGWRFGLWPRQMNCRMLHSDRNNAGRIAMCAYGVNVINQRNHPTIRIRA